MAGMTCKSCLKYNLLLIMMVIGMVCGIVVGILVRNFNPDFNSSKRNIMYLEFPGKIVLAMLKVLIVPLIVSTLIAGVSNLPSKAQGRLGGFTIGYYFLTTFIAVVLGILLVAAIRPGIDKDQVYKEKHIRGNAVDTFLDIIRNLFPDNIVEAAFRSTKTNVGTEAINVTVKINGTLQIVPSQRITDDFEVVQVFRTNTLGLICFSIAFGIMISHMGQRGQLLSDFFTLFSEAMMKLTTVVVYLVPFGIIFLVSSKIVSSKDLEDEFKKLGLYMVTVLVGLFIHGFIVLPLILFIIARRNPFKYVFHMARALITALGTASSSATMPLTLKCLRENAKIHPLVVNFVIPVGATINMDGTALYEAVASIYLAQRLGMDLNPADYVVVSVTATLAAIGAAGIPEAGLVTMLIVLQALGIPYDNVGFILAVDWFLDRCRTTINVWGDSVGAGVVEKLTKNHLGQYHDHQDEENPNSYTPPPSYNGGNEKHSSGGMQQGVGVYHLEDSHSDSTHL